MDGCYRSIHVLYSFGGGNFVDDGFSRGIGQMMSFVGGNNAWFS